MKKLYYIANIRLPTEKAHGIQIMSMCEAFAQCGNDVELVVPTRDNSIKEDPFDYYGIKRIFKIIYVPVPDLVKYGKTGYFISGIIFYIKTLRNSKNKKVYSRDLLSLIFYRKFTIEIHEWREKTGFFKKLFLKNAAIYVVLTNFLKNELLKNGIEEKRILVKSDGVDLDKFLGSMSKEEARKITKLPKDKFIALYCGSLSLYSWKGVDVIIDGACINKDEDVVYVLVGGSHHEIAEFQKKYPISNMILVPRQNQNDVPGYLKSADVLLLPNKSNDIVSKFHTSPLKMFEYMSADRPIVASNLPSIMEILNEDNSLLINPGDSGEINDAIFFLKNNHSRGVNIATQALKDVKNYSWVRRAEEITEYIHSYDKNFK